MHETPLQTFTSHVAGKNAKVTVYADRLEWKQPRGISGGKLAAGALTGGLSLLATGVKDGKSGTEMIPIASISSVTTKRDGMLNSKVCVITTGNTIDFRVSHGEAAGIANLLKQLILGSHPSQQQQQVVASAPTAPAAAPAGLPVDVMAQLQQLGQLRDAGVLTDDEFAAKKSDLLGRI
ncbi:SHOCT domain-containing protein [Paenarthrobacter nicotinovorans]|uniref:SHOCT domain-containing protein n=1 Tax=Paenarthrobacter nicotinovorans TaxID=29320 RepID=UPI00380CC7D2